MSEMDWLHSHVERCMQAVWEDPNLTRDGDGDYGFRSECGVGWIRVHDEPLRGVSASLIVVQGLPDRAAVLREINDVNRISHGAWLMLEDDCLLARSFLPADAVNPSTFEFMIGAVCAVADDVGPMLASVHGGTTAIPAETSDVD